MVHRLLALSVASLAVLIAPRASASTPVTEDLEVQRPERSGPPSLPPAPTNASATPMDPPVETADEPAVSPGHEVTPASITMPTVTAPPAPHAPLDLEPAGGADRWKRDYVRVQKPKFRGTGLMATAGGLYATAVTFQLGDLLLCGNCAFGVLERGFLASGAILAPIGAMMRGRADAYHDAAARRPFRETRGFIVGGAALAGVGVAAGIANEAMWWRCMRDGSGPYAHATDDWGWTECRYGVGRTMLNLSAAAVTAGLSMVAWGLRYRRDANVYRHARIVVAPQISRHEAIVSLAGRF